jgi:REP element-mobilizing transposase RayT
MAHSYTELLYHVIFSTKRREPFLVPSVLPRLCEYLGGGVRGEGGTALIVNGMPDHIHILARLRQDAALSDVLRAIKANSSGWIHETFPELHGFAWQSG